LSLRLQTKNQNPDKAAARASSGIVWSQAIQSSIVLPGSDVVSEAAAQPITAAAWKAAAGAEKFW